MEESRLKPMVDGYDEKLFAEIYKKTQNLRKKLAHEIDPRRFGVDYQEILSWFDVKFIYAFNRYYEEKSPELLKAHIIRALQFFKNRILRSAYSLKNQVNNNCKDINELYSSRYEPQEEFIYDETPQLLDSALRYLRDQMSPEAYQVLIVDLQPPFYILDRLGSASTTKIPSNLIADYLGWSPEEAPRINKLRKEISSSIEKARWHFRD